MNNNVNNILDGELHNSIEGMVDCFDKMNLTTEQIVEYISSMPLVSREVMHLVALSKGNRKLADKIDKANEIIELKTIEAFKKSVEDGTYENFLANMNWEDKVSLPVDMGLFRIGLSGEKPLTEEEQRYSDIIENSIHEDIKKEALSQGFESIEGWRNYIAMQRMGIEPQTEKMTLLLRG